MVDPGFGKDLTAITGYFRGLGATILTIPAPAGGGVPDEPDLAALIRNVAAANTCVDVILYLSGHGAEPTTRNGVEIPSDGSVNVGKDANGKEIFVDPKTVKTMLKAAPTITFKIIVDACFSGVWANTFTPAPSNVLVVVDSSPPTVKYYPGVCGVSRYTAALIASMKTQEAAAAADTSGADKAARLIELGNTASGWTVLSGVSFVAPPSVNALPPATSAPGSQSGIAAPGSQSPTAAPGSQPPSSPTGPAKSKATPSPTPSTSSQQLIGGNSIGFSDFRECTGSKIGLHIFFIGYPAGTEVVIKLSGPGLPPSLTLRITLLPGTNVSQHYAYYWPTRGSGTWADHVVSIDGKPPPSTMRLRSSSQSWPC
jgi:hypothetical protein